MQNDFSQGSVRPLIVRLAIPTILAEMVNALYNIVDRMYIGRIPGEGHLALAGLTLSSPILTIVSAFALLFGMGGAPLCSIARGERRERYAERILGNSFTMLVLTGAVLTAAGLVAKRPLLELFGASKNTIGYADAYLEVYLLGTLFVMISMGLTPFINAQGFTRVGMLSVALGAFLNVALDPVFIFAFGMGVRGAALATILSQAASAAWVLWFLLGKRAILRLKREHLRPDPAIIWRILVLGISNFTMRVTECAVQIVCNKVLSGYGDLYVTAMGVIGSIRQMLMLLLSGFVQGFQPVVGFNYGARLYARVRECIKFTTLVCFVFASASCLMVMLIPGPLIRIFNDSPVLLKIGIPAVRIYFCGFGFLFMQMAGQQSFVALGKSRQAVFFSLLRKAFIVLPLTVILPRFLGVNGVFWAEMVSDIAGSTACFATFMLTVYRRELTGGTWGDAVKAK